MKEEKETRQPLTLMEQAEARFGKERVEAWRKQYAPRKVTIIEVDGKICALAPVTAQAVSQFATLAANPQGGLESASRMLLESQWIDGDACLRDDDDYFITVMLQVQQLIELKKSSVMKL